MKILSNAESLDELIAAHPMMIVQIGSASCAPCSALKIRLDAWLAAHPHVEARYVPIEDFAELTAQHGVLSVPTIEVYVEGKLSIHEAGYFSLDALLDKVEKYVALLDL